MIRSRLGLADADSDAQLLHRVIEILSAGLDLDVVVQRVADLITETDSELTRLPMTTHRSRTWEPEPLRFLGVRYVQRSFQKLDEKAETTGAPPSGASLAERLTRH